MGKLHPKVQEFKEFVKRHPKMVEEVRTNNKTWQEFFEDWYMFGEDDEMWTKYASSANGVGEVKPQKSKKDSDLMSQIFGMVKNLDINEMQHHINNFSGAIANIQQLIKEFQGSNQNQSTNSNQSQHPFAFRKD